VASENPFGAKLVSESKNGITQRPRRNAGKENFGLRISDFGFGEAFSSGLSGGIDIEEAVGSQSSSVSGQCQREKRALSPRTWDKASRLLVGAGVAGGWWAETPSSAKPIRNPQSEIRNSFPAFLSGLCVRIFAVVQLPCW
jgi:hypothetical protein